MKYYIVDAFTDKPFGGNPAGVVLLGDNAFPDERLMMQIAAELRYSETVFVQRHSDNEYTIRYFTPMAEVELCGHATIAAFAMMHKIGIANGDCICHTKAGDLSIESGKRVMMQMATPHIIKTITDFAPLYHALGLDNYKPKLPVQVAYSGLSDIMLPIPDTVTLNTLQPNMNAIAALTERHNAVSFHLFAFANDNYTAHVRDLAPQYGIPEESATGTANAALTYYLKTNSVINQPCDCLFLQGEAMGRPSTVATRITADETIYVGGTAAIVAQGEILI